MLGYVKKSDILKIIESERDLAYSAYKRYSEFVGKGDADDFNTACAKLAVDGYSRYQECRYLISKIEKL